MEDVDSRDIGRYGTVHYMKRLIPNSPIVAFPVDDTEVTFGRDPACNIRLYYADISPLHCKLFVEENKAFLSVHGTNGVLIDGCHVYPNSASPAIVPLLNFSEFEIRAKKFRFSYPPKEMRATLLATPARCEVPRRELRLSMIQSALVFSPRPSPDPQENLRILQSPLRPFQRAQSHPAHEEEEIVLVHGDSPRVVEEDKDLVICEDVEVEEGSLERSPIGLPLPPQSPSRQAANPPQTPRNRPTFSLHRAVLIRSAQKAVLRAEIDKQEEDEEEEVEQFMMTPGLHTIDDTEEDQDLEEDPADDVEMLSGEGSDEDPDQDQELGDQAQASQTTGGWRKSLGSIIWPFRAPSSSDDHDLEDSEPIKKEVVDKIDSDEDDENTENAPPLQSSSSYPTDAPPRRLTTTFSTPQAARRGPTGPVRFSVGGHGDLKKIKREPMWRVKDIVIPESDEVKEEEEEEGEQPLRPITKLSEEQRQAIRDRRRSALTTPDSFFKGRAPGTGPRPSVGFTSPSKSSAGEGPSSLISPLKPKVLRPEANASSHIEEDTGSLLTKMKAQIEEAKRRQSDARISRASLPAMPQDTSENAPEPVVNPEAPIQGLHSIEEDEPMGNDLENAPGPSHQGLQTPLLRGVRELFQTREPPPTPSFEGVAEMMAEPAQVDEVVEVQEAEKSRKTASNPPPPTRRRGNLKSRTLKPAAVDTPSLADDEMSPAQNQEDEVPALPSIKKPAVRLLRSRSKTPDLTPKEEPEGEMVPKAAPKTTTRKTPASSSRTTKKAVVQGSGTGSAKSTAAEDSTQPVKRTRKTAATATATSTADEAAVPRRGAKSVPQATARDQEADEVLSDEPAPKTATKRVVKPTTTRRTKATTAEPAQAEAVGKSTTTTRTTASRVPAAAKPKLRPTTRKTAVTDPASSNPSQEDSLDKENAQSTDDHDASTSKPPPSKPKTRRAAATKGSATEPEAPPTTTRVTRARTRTG